jgi:fatty acid desaturase
MRRLVPKQALVSLYRFQHVYLPVIYGLLSLKVRVSDVTDFLFYRTNGPLRVNWPPHVLWRAVGVKCVWLGWRVALPMLLWGLSGAACFGFFMATEVVTGYWLAYNFQVSHITEGVTWPNGDVAAAAAADGGVPSKAAMKGGAGGGQAAAAGAAAGAEGQQAVLADSWAENQVRTSLDYAHHSGLWTYLCGALNYQVEHHLFPGVSQYHYPALAPMVKATCAEFGLPYLYKPDFPAAFAAHVRFLRSMGQQGKAVHMD